MDSSVGNICSDDFYESVLSALRTFDGYDDSEAGITVTVRSDLIETRRRQGMSALDVASFLATLDADSRARIAGKGESELLKAVREEEVATYELKEKGRIASILGLDVDELSPDELRVMWEEIPVVIQSLWNEKPWLSKQPGVPENAAT